LREVIPMLFITPEANHYFLIIALIGIIII